MAIFLTLTSKNRIRLHDLIVVQKRPLRFCIIKEQGTKHFYEILI